MGFKNSVKAIVMETVNAAALGGAYVAINPLGLLETCIKVEICNNSNINVYISWNGVDDNNYIPPETCKDLTFFSTAFPGLFTPQVKKGQIFYARTTGAPGVGIILVTGYYLESNI